MAGNNSQLANAVTAAALRAAGEALLQVERRHLFPGNSLIPPGRESSPDRSMDAWIGGWGEAPYVPRSYEAIPTGAA